MNFYRLKNEFVLLSTDENFENNLSKIAQDLGANLAYDAVGGEMTGALLNAMPANSEVVLYGGLSGKTIEGIGVLGLIFHSKVLSGFNLKDWIKNNWPGKVFAGFGTIARHVYSGQSKKLKSNPVLN